MKCKPSSGADDVANVKVDMQHHHPEPKPPAISGALTTFSREVTERCIHQCRAFKKIKHICIHESPRGPDQIETLPLDVAQGIAEGAPGSANMEMGDGDEIPDTSLESCSRYWERVHDRELAKIQADLEEELLQLDKKEKDDSSAVKDTELDSDDSGELTPTVLECSSVEPEDESMPNAPLASVPNGAAVAVSCLSKHVQQCLLIHLCL